jgi:hypothetical protein
MSIHKTYGVTFEIDRDYFEEIYYNKIVFYDETLEEAYGDHFEMMYLRDFGNVPTCIINILERHGPNIDIIPLLLRRLHIERTHLTLTEFMKQ